MYCGVSLRSFKGRRGRRSNCCAQNWGIEEQKQKRNTVLTKMVENRNDST